MKNLKRLSAGLLALLMALSLAACGSGTAPSGGDGDTADLTADQILAKSNEAMADISSMSYTMLMDMEMSAMDETVNFITDATCDFVADPMAMKMEISMDMGEEYGSAKMIMYMVPQGDEFMVYMAEDNGTGELEWESASVGSLEELGLDQYDAKDSMSLYMDNGTNFEIAGTDTVEGIKAVRLEGVIPEADLAQVMEESGMMEQFASLGVTDASAFEGMGDLPISIWVADDGTFYPVKCEMDMTAMMQSLMDTMMAELGAGDDVSIDIGKVFVSMTMYNFNELTTIELPADIDG